MDETRVLCWICESCDTPNLREVLTTEEDVRHDVDLIRSLDLGVYWNGEENLIFDDKCDHCEQKVHEPITRVKTNS